MHLFLTDVSWSGGPGAHRANVESGVDTNEDALVFGKFIRVANSWEFVATGEKHNGSLNKLIELYT